MSTEIVTTCINCVAPGSLWSTLIVMVIGAAMAAQYERPRAE